MVSQHKRPPFDAHLHYNDSADEEHHYGRCFIKVNRICAEQGQRKMLFLLVTLSTWDNSGKDETAKERLLLCYCPHYFTPCSHSCYVTLISKQSGWWESVWLLSRWCRIETTQNSTQSAFDSPFYTPSRDYHLSLSFHRSPPFRSTPPHHVTVISSYYGYRAFLGECDCRFGVLSFVSSVSQSPLPFSHSISSLLSLSSPSLSIFLPWQLLNYWFDEIFSCYSALLLKAPVVA